MSHRLHRFTQILLRSPDVLSHADLAFPSAADFQFADFADFLPFYPLSSHTDLTDLTDFFTFLPFYPFTFKSLFTFRKLYKMLTPKVSFLPMKHLNHRNETILLRNETICLNYFLYICGMKGHSGCRGGRLCMSGERLWMTGERIRMQGERLCMTVEFPLTARWGLPHPSGWEKMN